MSPLEFTGERFVPGVKGEIWVEHWHRYHFAARWVAGRRVLDVACGEGYGSALLARSAAHVTGVDVSPEAVGHATRAYAALANVRFACASCTRLPLADASIDVAVSFETLEHIAAHDDFLDELARVLRPGGVLLLSCPNKLEYSDKRGYANEFHVKELYREELARLLAARFPHADWYGQRPSFFSLIAPEGMAAGAQLVEVDEERPDVDTGRLSSPLYFIVAASREAQALVRPERALSVLVDRGDWVHRDYEHVMKDLHHHAARHQELREKVERDEQAMARLGEELARFRTAVTLQETAFSAQRALMEAQAEAHQAEARALRTELEQSRREVVRRQGWRWWLRLPFVRMGLLKA